MRPAAALGSLAVLVAAVAGVALFELSRPAPPPSRKVKLAVLVVFDQMRGDYLQRWKPLFGPGGFARLQRDGAWFTNCHYPYGTTTTGPGHASMLTGACGDSHGIINNYWLEGAKVTYCATRERYKPVPPQPVFPPDEKDKKDAKPAEPKEFGSPERLLSETVADVLKQTYGKSKVFGLSLKDRSAILPTGQRPDGAYWFYGTFGTSTYYADKLPSWVASFNASGLARSWFNADWTPVHPDLDGGRFRHRINGGKPQLGPKYYEALAASPYGNALLLDFAKTCIEEEKLGADDKPDLLVVSFSSNDLIGHVHGPDSPEVLDVTLRSDAVMADLLRYLDEKVGKGQYLLAVTADHGICPVPEVSRANGIADARRVDPKELREALDAHLTATFPATKQKDGKPARWVEEGDVFPWVYLRPQMVKLSGRSREEIAAEAGKFLPTRPGVARTFTRAELSGPFPASDAVANRVKRSFYPPRSGDVYILLQPYCIPSTAKTGTTHGTPYEYDTHVPLLVYGPGIRGGAREEPTTPQALASIFAKWLNVPRPKDAAFPIPETLE